MSNIGTVLNDSKKTILLPSIITDTNENVKDDDEEYYLALSTK